MFPMLKAAIRRLPPLRRRHQVRLLVGGYPAPLRQNYPDLELLHLGTSAVVIDVGANIGQFADMIFRRRMAGPATA